MKASKDWAECEFGRSDLADERLRDRLKRIGRRWCSSHSKTLLELFLGLAEQMALHRFLHNGRVSAEDILQPHWKALVECVGQHREVLLVQDTTTINRHTLKDVAKGLGRIGGKGHQSHGLPMHACVAFAPDGRPLGVASLEIWARPPKNKPSKGPCESKESARWLAGFEMAGELGRLCPNTRVLSVCDREADNFELFQLQARHSSEAGLLVRASKGRERTCLEPEGRQVHKRNLWQLVELKDPVVTGRPLHSDVRGGPNAREKRSTTTGIRIASAVMQPPREFKQAEPIEAGAVQVRDSNPPDKDPPEWMLVCSDGPLTAENVQRIVRFHEARWGIEEFFRLLRGPPAIGSRQQLQGPRLRGHRRLQGLRPAPRRPRNPRPVGPPPTLSPSPSSTASSSSCSTATSCQVPAQQATATGRPHPCRVHWTPRRLPPQRPPAPARSHQALAGCRPAPHPSRSLARLRLSPAALPLVTCAVGIRHDSFPVSGRWGLLELVHIASAPAPPFRHRRGLMKSLGAIRSAVSSCGLVPNCDISCIVRLQFACI